MEELEHQLSQRDEELEVKVLPISFLDLNFEAAKCEGSSKGCKLSLGIVHAFILAL